MKKVISIALALMLMLSLSVTAFADDQEVYAKLVPDMSISSTITWYDMYFVYAEATNTWYVDEAHAGSNAITVQNNSPRASFDVLYSYSTAEFDHGEQVDYDDFNNVLSTESVSSYVVTGELLPATMHEINGTPTSVTNNTLYPNDDPERVWFMFTDNNQVGRVSTADFVQVGTLTITLSTT